MQVGDAVGWCGVTGSYAEQVAVPAGALVKLPQGIDTRTAAAALLQGMTAHYLAFSICSLGAGDSVLVHAGAGGTGLLLIQMAKRTGATVYTTVSTEEKATLAKDAGADVVINYTTENFAERVMEGTNGRGAKAVFDAVGKTTIDGSPGVPVAQGLPGAIWSGERPHLTHKPGQYPEVDLPDVPDLGRLYRHQGRAGMALLGGAGLDHRR